MNRRLKIAAAGGSTLLVVAGLAIGGALMAVRQVQPFYASAIQIEPRKLQSASREMESRVAALVSDVKPPGRWEATFSDAEVNGWLAVTLAEKFPELLAPEVADPRVAFVDGGVLVGFRWRGERLDSVISVQAEARMLENDVLAVRLLQVRAGALPLPLSDVVEQVSLGAEQLEWPLTWTYEEGVPVALLPTAHLFPADKRQRRLEMIEMREGELLLSGTTAPVKSPQVAAQEAPAVSR